MSRRLLATIVVVLAIAACADDREQSPTSPDFGKGGGGATTCNYNDVKKYARDLFGASSAEATIAQNMSGFPAGSASATSLGFDLLAAIATKRNGGTGLTDTEISNGANLAANIVPCSDVKTFGETTVAAFSSALASGGAFEVPVSGTSTVLASDKQAGIRAFGNDFLTWLDARALIFGYPLADPFADGELTGTAAGLTGRVTFEWSVVAEQSVNLPTTNYGTFSQCVIVDNDADLFKLRIEKLTQLLEVSASPIAGLECPAPPADFTRADRSNTLGQRLLALLAPAPLHAAALGRTGSPTGSAGSFSPFQVSNPVNVVVTFTQQPRDGKVNTALPTFKVKVTGSKGKEWEGVLVQVTAFNNNGVTVETDNDQAVTDADGIATFDELIINKAGAYKLSAITVSPSEDPDVNGFAAGSSESKKFNVRP
jgi:hypothetical protein